MYSKYKITKVTNNYDDINLRPSWYGKIDWSNGCNINYKNRNMQEIIKNNNNNNNNINININILKNHNNNEINNNNDNNNEINNNNDDNDDNNDSEYNNKLNTKFIYYSERAEFIEKNAVFIKPQYKNIDNLEDYLKLIKKDKYKHKYSIYNPSENIIENISENPIQNLNEIPKDDIIENDDIFQTQKKKNRSSKYSLASLLLSPTQSDNNTSNNTSNNDRNKKKLLNYKSNNTITISNVNNYYDSDNLDSDNDNIDNEAVYEYKSKSRIY